jgi:CRP-like cAMP-binding protein
MKFRWTRELLPDVALFSGLSGADARRVAAALDCADVEDGDCLQRRGRRVGWVLVPLSCSLRLVGDGALTPGMTFGDVEVLLQQPARHDVLVEGTGRVASLPAGVFADLIAETPSAQTSHGHWQAGRSAAHARQPAPDP